MKKLLVEIKVPDGMEPIRAVDELRYALDGVPFELKVRDWKVGDLSQLKEAGRGNGWPSVCLIVGRIDKWELVGPFWSAPGAEEWAEDHLREETWWLAETRHPGKQWEVKE